MIAREVNGCLKVKEIILCRSETSRESCVFERVPLYLPVLPQE